MDQFVVVLTFADFDSVKKSCESYRLGPSSMDITKTAKASWRRCFQRCSTAVDRKETAGNAAVERVRSRWIRRVLLQHTLGTCKTVVDAVDVILADSHWQQRRDHNSYFAHV